MKDFEEFEQLRRLLSDEIQTITKRLSYKKSLKKIKKEAYKNMIEGPAVNFAQSPFVSGPPTKDS
jgi:pyoverdine/dityrosine biosynthesis protein Dit1